MGQRCHLEAGATNQPAAVNARESEFAKSRTQAASCRLDECVTLLYECVTLCVTMCDHLDTADAPRRCLKSSKRASDRAQAGEAPHTHQTGYFPGTPELVTLGMSTRWYGRWYESAVASQNVPLLPGSLGVAGSYTTPVLSAGEMYASICGRYTAVQGYTVRGQYGGRTGAPGAVSERAKITRVVCQANAYTGT